MDFAIFHRFQHSELLLFLLSDASFPWWQISTIYNVQKSFQLDLNVWNVFYVSFFDVPFFQNIVMIPKRSLLHLEFKTLQCCPRHSLF